MTAKYKTILADTLLPLNAVIMRNGEPVDHAHIKGVDYAIAAHDGWLRQHGILQ